MLKKKNPRLGSLDFHLEMPYRKNLEWSVLQGMFIHRETHLVQPIDLTYSLVEMVGHLEMWGMEGTPDVC